MKHTRHPHFRLTGIVFSLVFLMIQFNATAYSPRLVLWLARDPVMPHALGVFSATFLYGLMVLAWVDRNATGRVPFISGWMVLALLLASLGMFIALTGRIGLLQVGRMLVFTGDQGRAAIAELYSRQAAASPAADAACLRSLPFTQSLYHVGRPQVIQAIQFAALVELATKAGAVIEVLAVVGDTVLEMASLPRLHGASQPLDEDALKRAFEAGDERTFEQDPKYTVRLVVDIAIQALSPAINDPTTAVQAWTRSRISCSAWAAAAWTAGLFVTAGATSGWSCRSPRGRIFCDWPWTKFGPTARTACK